MQIAGAIEMFGRHHEAEQFALGFVPPPNRPDQIAERRVVDDLPTVCGGIECSGFGDLRSVIHARACTGFLLRAARRHARSGMSFSALAPATSARPLAPSPRTASV